MMLNDLLKYKHIVIQCHDIPDADAICSGYALQSYFCKHNIDTTLVYAGVAKITKPSLVMLIEMLNIDISHVNEIPEHTDLLITVDCQRGAGNVQNISIPDNVAIAVIDHHRPEINETENIMIRPYLASCATLVWDLLQKEKFEMESSIVNSLFYGLFTDTNGLSELRHPLDRDLSEIPYDSALIRRLKNSAITIGDLDIVSKALMTRDMFQSIGLFEAELCDANLLGFTSDIAQQVARMDCCIVYCRLMHGLKLSIRSSAREIMASEIAEFLCKDVGSGGGNIEKAGGFISFSKILEAKGSIEPAEYLKSRITAYNNNYEHIYANNHSIDFSEMNLYKKIPVPVGYVVSTNVYETGTKITIRTLEGDVDTIIHDDIFFMIGILGEVYPIKQDRFYASYNATTEPFSEELEYEPIILNRLTGERKPIMPKAFICVPKNNKLVRAKELIKDTKVFTNWDLDKYFYGAKGDYLVANEDDYHDCYIVRGDIFHKTYEAYNRN